MMPTLPNITSTIFVENANSIDSAILLPEQLPQGISWIAGVTWQGNLTREEVVFDFSIAKQTAKSTLDANFDHKLLLASNFVIESSDENTLVFSSETKDKSPKYFILYAPNQGIAILPEECFPSKTEKELNLKSNIDNSLSSWEFMSNVFAEAIAKASPQNIQQVNVNLKESELLPPRFSFSYMHSLQHHCGNCQRFHGHASRIEIYLNNELLIQESTSVANYLHNKYFINKDHCLTTNTSPLFSKLINSVNTKLNLTLNLDDLTKNHTLISYTGNQGQVNLIFPTERIVKLPSASTIENIAKHALAYIIEKDPKKYQGKLSVIVYEGLQKGVQLDTIV